MGGHGRSGDVRGRSGEVKDIGGDQRRSRTSSETAVPTARQSVRFHVAPSVMTCGREGRRASGGNHRSIQNATRTHQKLTCGKDVGQPVER